MFVNLKRLTPWKIQTNVWPNKCLIKCDKIVLNATCKIVGKLLNGTFNFVGSRWEQLNGKIKNVVGFGAKKWNIINLYDIMSLEVGRSD